MAAMSADFDYDQVKYREIPIFGPPACKSRAARFGHFTFPDNASETTPCILRRSWARSLRTFNA
jgi:hypothetical protein